MFCTPTHTCRYYKVVSITNYVIYVHTSLVKRIGVDVVVFCLRIFSGGEIVPHMLSTGRDTLPPIT